MKIKALIPPNIRLQYQLGKRAFLDAAGRRRFAKAGPATAPFQHTIVLEQAILPSHLYENKVANIKMASERISRVLIAPGELLSFWKIIGAPTAQNGFLKGRNIVAGQLSEDYGGGLCQLSGILYHLSLIAGLEIMERHNHSVDIYTDETRYSPLGADATVVYGYKDLRIKNGFSFPIRFIFEFGSRQLKACLESPEPIREKNLQFERKHIENQIVVACFDETGRVVGRSVYALKK